MPNPNAVVRLVIPALALLGAPALAPAQSGANLARYFGFDEPRFIVVDDGMGPTATADFDADARMDLAVVNNRKSRIEIYTQRTRPRSDEDLERDYKVNEFKPSRWFDKTQVSVSNRVTAFLPYDLDADGDLDIIYAGRSPREVVVLTQTSPMTFEKAADRRISDLAPGQDGIAIADVTGDADPEFVVIVGSKIHVFRLGPNGPMGEPIKLGSSGDIVAFFVEDYNGDGLSDILAVIPEDVSPLRLWLQGSLDGGAKRGLIGPEIRFELPNLTEVEPVRFEGRAAASVSVIEKASRRMVLYDVVTEDVEGLSASLHAAERDATARVYAFHGGDDKDRSLDVADIDADGMLDLIATDRAANAVVLHLQEEGVGLGDGRTFSALEDPKTVATGQWDADLPLEVFILSEEEKVVGVADYDPATKRLSVPSPLTIATGGSTPVAMRHITLKDGPAVALVVKDKRDHTLELHRPGGAQAVTVELEGVKRPPQSMLAGDLDSDGKTDLALFTPSEPMVVVRSIDGEAGQIEVLTDEQMNNFGLVQSAGPDNTALFDADGDGDDDLLIANKNIVRGTSFHPERGWDLTMQVNVADPSTSLKGLTILDNAGEPIIVASDSDNSRLILFRRDAQNDWRVGDKLRISGFEAGAIEAGAFAGDDQPNILAFSDEGFALVRLGGQQISLQEFAAHRSDKEDLYEHEIEVGDVNDDGFLDIVVLEAREHEVQIFTLSERRVLHPATSFQVFETRLFERGFGGRGETEPRYSYLADLTGDGLTDLTIAVHDRFIIYPQSRRR